MGIPQTPGFGPENNIHQPCDGNRCSLLKTMSGKGSDELNYHTTEVVRLVCIGGFAHLHVEARFSQCEWPEFEMLVAQTTGTVCPVCGAL